nr:MAG TPA: hypothetical protein [Caudoviricetes sp.]
MFRKFHINLLFTFPLISPKLFLQAIAVAE